MSDSSRSDNKPAPIKPGPPGIGTPFAGESSPGNTPSPEKSPQFDPNATIIDTTSRFDPAAKLADADATILDFQAKQADANATVPPETSARHTPSPRSPSPPGTIANPKASAAEARIGELLCGRYELLQLLGEGGMGAVYKARDLELEREVALKVIRPEMANHPEILQRFKQELILARQVTDRNVIRIFDIGEADKTKFITMEYLEGENLNQILSQRGKLEVAEAVGIMEQVACGLAAAHREGIIHRDLKPGNIM
ncbi:MAG: serine/threonine-protein kinase, partial [Terracidiphilus sp.]